MPPMLDLFTMVAALMAAAASPAHANTLCPPHEVGAYPWAAYGPKEGDLWVWVDLDLDQGGHPLRCYIGKSNMSGPQTLSDVCSSFLADWRTSPLIHEGSPVAGRTRRLVVMMSRPSQRRFARERERWFADHPEVSRECFPLSRTNNRLAIN